MTHFKSKASYLKNYVIKLVVENKCQFQVWDVSQHS